MFCTKCGQSLQDDAQFCHACGSKVAVNTVAQSPTPVVPPTAQPISESVSELIPPRVSEPISQTVTQPISKNASSCYHHVTEQAAGSCRRCSKAICSDCIEAFTPVSGSFENQCLCYDCYSNLLQSNINDIAKERDQMLDNYNRLHSRMKIGAIVGAVIGLAQWIPIMVLDSLSFGAKILFALLVLCFSIGGWGVLFGFYKEYTRFMIQSSKDAFRHATRTPDMYTNLGTGCLVAIGKPFVLWYQLIRSYLNLKNQIREYEDILESENQSLQWARDQMNFWKLRNRNKSLSLQDLMAREPSLQSNSYAQHLLSL